MSVRRAGPPAGRLAFVGVDEVGERPHVMVDGAERPGSVLVLSHWPGSPTPGRLWRDLSVEIVLAALGAPRRLWHTAECVTLDHLDEDGLASLFCVVDPETGSRLAERVVAFGRAGDFGVADRDSARAVFAVRTLCDRRTSPWSAPGSSSSSWSTECLNELLAIFEEILTVPAHFESAWHDEAAAFESSLLAIRRGDVSIEERPDVSLAVVRVHRSFAPTPVLADRAISGTVHPFALHTATASPRMLVFDGARVMYHDRYETWVRFVSRRLPLRRDLVPLADRLTSMEPASIRWQADPPSSLVPTLSTSQGEESSLSPDEIERAVVDHLARAPAAWDPFRQTRLTLVPRPRARRARV